MYYGIPLSFSSYVHYDLISAVLLPVLYFNDRSGSAANLELAIQVIKQNVVPVNQVLFAFWGAEELGLLGSSHYVNELSKDERAGIALNLNYDMIVIHLLRLGF